MSLRRTYILLSLMLALMPQLATPAIAAGRDPLAPVFDMEAQPFEAFPPELIAEDNQQAIVELVNEARLFGVPVAVRVVSRDGGHQNLPQLDNAPANARIDDDTMRELAQAWMEREPIESSPGAEDGFLMLVIMPEDETQSSAIIEPAANALPLNGLTAGNIDQVVDDLMLPSFDQNQVSQGIRTGLSVFSYNNLFARPERLELDDLHTDLRMVAGFPLAGATALAALGLAGLAWWISRRDVIPARRDSEPLSPFAAGALHEGRVDDAVVTGGLLELMRRGVLRANGRDILVDEHAASALSDPFLCAILDTLRQNTSGDRRLDPAAMRHVSDLTGPARRMLEDDLATRGLFNRDGKVQAMWLLLASGLVGTLALFTLLPSILGMAGTGIAAILLAAIVIVGVLVWAARRSWTTSAGQDALERWSATATVEDRVAYDAIVHQDDLISTVGGPLTPPTIALVRTLRGLGAT